ncbi:MAG: cytochrome c biogenesis protein ResB [Phycisphaerae bacterium]|nr:cytochrome c biogenesis protein ResB [Phycisphaerae bacterium]
MVKFNRVIMWMVLLTIGLLIALSIAGAFYGAEKAKFIFNSVPLAVYWYGLAVLLLAGLVEFPRLLRKPGLFMIHAGCLLVLGGGMWGSEAGHRISERFFGTHKIPSGYMLIVEGCAEKYITAKDLRQRLGELPFSIKLNDFRIDYYDAGENTNPLLNIETPEGEQFQLPAEPNKAVFLGQNEGTLKVVRVFKNFRIQTEGGKKVAMDAEGQADNPALEVSIETPDGNSLTRYVFERFAGFDHGKNKLQLNYTSQKPQMVRDYFSDVTVIKDGKEIVSKTIEVNHPLHYRGYHFYQHSYDSEAGKYTILSITSDSGLYVVYAGYWMLCIGVAWWFWLQHLINYVKGKKYI